MDAARWPGLGGSLPGRGTFPDRPVPSFRPRIGPAAALLATCLAGGPAAAQDAVPVTTATAETAPVQREIRLTGSVTSPRVAEVSTSVGGLVERVRVDTGDRVAEGDLLVELDRELETLTLEQARASVREARAQLADTRRRLEEARRLLERKGIPESEVRSLEAEVRVDKATLERLQAEQQHQAEELRRHTLEAPFAGVVSRKLTAPGEWVNPGTAVIELVGLDSLRLDFQAPQAYYPRISRGDRAAVKLDALPEQELEGRVTATIPVSDPDSRTFTVRVHLARDGVPITPGMSASARLRLGTDREGVVIPRDALLRHPDGRETVWVVREGPEGPTVSERTVRTGLAFNGRIEIRKGLEAGIPVVTRGNEALQQGQSVRIREEGR